MERSLTDLIKQSYEDLRGQWGIMILTLIVFSLLSSAGAIIPIIPLIIAGPLVLGMSIVSLNVIRSREIRIEQLFDGFQNFGNALGAYILMILIILAGFLLFVIPGIIISMMLSMTFYILADNEHLSPVEALKKSRALMDGHKLDFFLLQLMFMGMGLLCLLTCGIGFLFLGPLYYVTMARFYESIKGEAGSDMNVEGDSLDSDFV